MQHLGGGLDDVSSQLIWLNIELDSHLHTDTALSRRVCSGLSLRAPNEAPDNSSQSWLSLRAPNEAPDKSSQSYWVML
jgi:hypothetical protein